MGLIPQWLRKKEERAVVQRSPFDLDTELLRWSPVDGFTIREACTHVAIFGRVGSAKTTGSAALIRRSYLAAGMGALICCTKDTDCEMYLRDLEATGRLGSAIIVRPGEGWYLNLLDHAARIGGVEGVVEMLVAINELTERGAHGGGGNHDQYFKQNFKRCVRYATVLRMKAHLPVTAETLNALVMSAPMTFEESRTEEWASSALSRTIEQADAYAETPSDKRDIRVGAEFFLIEFPALAPETKGSILGTWGTGMDCLRSGVMADLFADQTNFIPEVTFGGAIVILDLPTHRYGRYGVVLQGAFTALWQRVALMRDVKANPRPIFFICDEFHELVTAASGRFFAEARSKNICCLVITQSISGYYSALGAETGKYQTEAMLQALSYQIFHACSGETARYASKLLAKSWQTKMNWNTSRGERDQHSGGGTEDLQEKVLEAEFATLRSGGPPDFITQCIVVKSGVFASGETFIRTSIKQLF